ncbi:hypothetical protein SAMN05444008_11725 [Cnuella takakiae]|uniref:Lipoprotein n=1 Tax=Cnuella takakiae TaxID=1302690 RepID=A0A1M5GR72_9BACT|nr:hypothetical protein [Cnuella takakiae]OLY90919.1 hypothetical protein BUE76_02655 [Cnuella takakiae]SHG06224.1 hypothetical protein SAMN05444008_11725 [Cnuella takakiae]
MKTLLPALAALLLLLTACGPAIYKTNDFATVAATHKTVAILPAQVAINLRPNEMRRTTPEMLEKNEAATGYAIQEKLYGWFLRRSNRFHYTVKFQDVSQTNALLEEARLSYTDLSRKSRAELARLLGVDAVISTQLRTDKPMNEGVAIAMGLVFGAWGSTNQAVTTIHIHEANQGDLLWKYDYQAQGSVGSSPENLVNALMRNASRKFPYNGK